ncbi:MULTISPECIES: ATP-binding protein [Streptomyces]|uniref:ATP-binding protein n=1 Tax=Streptomyces TaxID=1883 RepID=UPI0006EB6055|nr:MULTISPECIES: ATP-binding protein [Streptomyces]
MTLDSTQDTSILTGARSPGAARETVRALLGQGHHRASDTAVADAVLVTSELVTNAIRHGGGLRGFLCRVHSGFAEIAVDDASDEVPVTRVRHSLLTSGGHGWPSVCRLASDVTVRHLPQGGKRITARIPLSSPAHP